MNEVLARNILLYWKIGKSAILEITKKTTDIVSTQLGWEQAQMRDKLSSIIDDEKHHLTVKAAIFTESFTKPDGSKVLSGKVNELELRKLCSIGAVKTVREVDLYRPIEVYTLNDYSGFHIEEYIPKMPTSKTFRKNFINTFSEQYMCELDEALTKDLNDSELKFENTGRMVNSLNDANKLIEAISYIGCASMFRELINMKYEVLDEIAEEILDAAEAVKIRNGFRLK